VFQLSQSPLPLVNYRQQNLITYVQEPKMKRLILCFFAFPCFAADIKPTLTVEQAQIIINLSNAEMEKACSKGSCVTAEPVLGVIKEIVRAAREGEKK
jgi:hypothetical protein